MTFIPGMEFSSRIEHGSIHILAYLVDPDFAPLTDELDKLQNDRENRLRQMTENVSADYDITWEHVMEQVAASGKSLGRPHLADALVAQGIIGERGEAFDGILSKNGPYYVPQYALDPVSAVKLIRDAGGVPVMAHPTTKGRVAPMEYIDRLIEAGLGGYEIEHRENMEPGKTILREHRGSLLVMGILSGYLGAAPSLLWASGAMFVALAPLLVPVAIWIYTLVFAFASLWFAHFTLAALQRMRAAQVVEVLDPEPGGQPAMPLETLQPTTVLPPPGA